MNTWQLGMVLMAIDKMSGPITQACSTASRGLGGLQAKAMETARKMAEIGTAASLAGHQILQAMQTPVSAFADQDEAFNNLGVALMDNLGRIPPQFAEIKSQALELGNLLPGTTSDMINAAAALSEKGAGLDAIINGGLKASAYLGVILKQQPAYAAEMVAKFREAYGLSENELVKMADLTQKAKFAFGMAPDEIKAAASYSGAMLNTLKLTDAENAKMMLAFQGTASQHMLEGSQFGTNFSMMLSQIGQLDSKLGRNSKVMKQVNAELDHYGINLQFFDKKGEFGGLENLFKQMEKLRVLSQEERLLVLTKLFGQEGMRPASLAVDMGVTGLHEAVATLDRQADIMQRIDHATKSAKNTWEAFTGTLTNLAAALGGPMVTALYPLLNKLNELTGGPLMLWVEQNQELVKWLGIGALATGVLLIGLGGLGIAASFAARGFAVAAGGLKLLAGGIGWAVTAVRGLSLAMLSNPVGLIVGALVVGAMLVYKYWVPIKNFFIGFWEGLKQGLAPVLPLFVRLGAVLSWAVTPLKMLWQWFMNLLTPVDDAGNKALAFGQRVGLALGKLGHYAIAAMTGLAELPKVFFEAGSNIITSIYQGVQSKAQVLLDKVKEIAGKVRAFFPFSPAKAGPLRDIHKIKFVETIAAAMQPGPLVKAASGVAAAGMLALAPLSTPNALAMPRPAPALASGAAAHAPGAGGAGGQITVNFSPQVTVNGQGGQESADQVLAVLRSKMPELLRMISQAQAVRDRRAF